MNTLKPIEIRTNHVKRLAEALLITDYSEGFKIDLRVELYTRGQSFYLNLIWDRYLPQENQRSLYTRIDFSDLLFHMVRMFDFYWKLEKILLGQFKESGCQKGTYKVELTVLNM